MKSNGGILFAGCTIASGFSGVFCDQGYCESWMVTVLAQPQVLTFLGLACRATGMLLRYSCRRLWHLLIISPSVTQAIASRPDTTTKGYMLGGLSWFAIPWAFGTVMGLSCRALMTNPNFPTFPYVVHL